MGRYQEATTIACIHGGASLLPSNGACNRLVHKLNAVEPTPEMQRPLSWSNQVITFVPEDPPDCNSGMGLIPLIMSPTIQNVKVTKMLVDRGAGLNLLSAKLLKMLQIPLSRLKPTGVF